MFGKKRRNNIRALNKVSWDHAFRLELLELEVAALKKTEHPHNAHYDCHYQQGYVQGVKDAPMIAKVATDGEYISSVKEGKDAANVSPNL